MDRATLNLWKRTFDEVDQLVRRAVHKCLVPDCNKTAIRSHSQQKEGQLRAIARAGKVYAIESSMARALGVGGTEAPLSLNLVGIARASVFAGFCAEHDRQLFEPIEIRPISEGDAKQANCFFLRAIAYEIARKRDSYFRLGEITRLAAERDLPFDYELVGLWRQGIGIYLNLDGPFYLRSALSAVQGVNSQLNSTWFSFASTVGASCTCCIQPPSGDRAERLADGKPQHLVTFSLVPGTTVSYAVLGWHKEDDSFVYGLLPEWSAPSNRAELLNRFAFYESEDTCINPDLWESATPETQRKVLEAMRHDAYRDTEAEVPKFIQLP